MIINNENEFIEICQIIKQESKSLHEWELIESDDYFQTSHFCGGFDATEGTFCFSYYDDKNTEYWFQITLEEVDQILKQKNLKILKFRAADI